MSNKTHTTQEPHTTYANKSAPATITPARNADNQDTK